MDNEKAIKILKKGYPDIHRYATIELAAYEYDVEAYNEAVGYAISHLEADRWIPVSERLPEESGFYIVTIADKYQTYVNTLFFMKSTPDMWEHDKRVLAWKPLPDPYKEEGAE